MCIPRELDLVPYGIIIILHTIFKVLKFLDKICLSHCLFDFNLKMSTTSCKKNVLGIRYSTKFGRVLNFMIVALSSVKSRYC